jgi:RNA 3'-terminal phosphate cyclase (ATP)
VETDTGALFGADAIGELGKMSETVGREAAQKFYSDVSAKPTVDTHLADMLIPYMALAKGTSVFLTRAVSEHLETNMWLVEKMLGVRLSVSREKDLYRIEKSG